MRLPLLCVCGVLVINLTQSSVAVSSSTSKVGDKELGGDREVTGGGCPVKLRPAGQCSDEDECPYQITLPPLTIQLPKQFRLLEKTVKELQSLKETVNRLKNTCLEGKKYQADQNLQRDSSEPPLQDQPAAISAGQDISNISTTFSNSLVKEMQIKMNRMSTSLRNARNQINGLQGQLEGIKILNLKNVEAIVDNKVENISNVVSRLSSTCSSQCPARNSPQHILAPRDCSDYGILDVRKNGVYKVTPDPRNSSFEVFCDMESYGGGWTVVQQRLHGNVSFNRMWNDYKKGFGDLHGEFWLGNDNIHLLTKAKDMILRVELEDFEGVRGYAKYDQFYIANEFLRYRLSISGYSGTAGDALHFSKHFNHDQCFFTTPDRDNDRYPSGNCGAYYSSGWWFDACMSANLNGKYYHKRYKGVRNGIFWGTWHNMSSEYYPTNYRQAFKTVKMMIRPKNYVP
ncbi:fibrinogen-like 2a [Chanos chanos]|uniref:Fibrinogen-like 2a n=1 Tax=Chanos chanos TaxID=29144 RepID=A0A6J2VCX9_CHACN|nr:fibroleukin [Chanos chanos]